MQRNCSLVRRCSHLLIGTVTLVSERYSNSTNWLGQMVTVHNPESNEGGWFMSETGFDGGGDEGEGVATLLAAGLDHCQHRFDKAAEYSERRRACHQGSFDETTNKTDDLMGCQRAKPLTFCRRAPRGIVAVIFEVEAGWLASFPAINLDAPGVAVAGSGRHG